MQTQWTVPMNAHHTSDTEIPHNQQCRNVVHWNVFGSQKFPKNSWAHNLFSHSNTDIDFWMKLLTLSTDNWRQTITWTMTTSARHGWLCKNVFYTKISAKWSSEQWQSSGSSNWRAHSTIWCQHRTIAHGMAYKLCAIEQWIIIKYWYGWRTGVRNESIEHIQINIFGRIEVDWIDGGDHNQHAQRNWSEQFDDMLSTVFESFLFIFVNIWIIVWLRWRWIGRSPARSFVCCSRSGRNVFRITTIGSLLQMNDG